MKRKSLVLGVGAIFFVVALNVNDALNDYGLLGNNLASQVLAQTQTKPQYLDCNVQEWVRGAVEGFDYVTTHNGEILGVTGSIPDTDISIKVEAGVSGYQTFKVHVCKDSENNCCKKTWMDRDDILMGGIH